MAIQSITTSLPSIPSITELSGSAPKQDAAGFADSLKSLMNEVSGAEANADKLAASVAAGDVNDLHNAMIAMRRASMAMELTVQIRNRVLDAYQEIMRMQV